MTIDVRAALAAMSEPSRFRIVELLTRGPRTVGEVAAGIGALQPQTTKHLQALEAAGILRVRRLGRRRIASIDPQAMGALAAHFATLAAGAEEGGRDDGVLDRYERGIAQAASALGSEEGIARTLRFQRELAAPPSAVWDAWTRPDLARRWWAPRHFTVTDYALDPIPGGAVRLALREGDGATYASVGEVIAAAAPRRLVFDLAPVDAGGRPLLAARHTLRLHGDAATALTLQIEVTARDPEAAPAVAGLEPGWEDLLDRLAAVVGPGDGPS